MVNVLDSHFLSLTAIITLLFFIITALLRIDKVTDFAGSTNFVILGVLTLALKGSWHFRQAIWVWIVSLPITIVNATDRAPSVKPQEIIGWLIWFVGIIVADQQKLVFKNSPTNRGKWCNIGIWKYSRHPNYFREILLWWGIFVASTPVLKGAEWLVIISPIFFMLLLLFVCGTPLLEKSADKQYSSSGDYHIYKLSTSPLVPLLPSVYGNLPWFKVAFLFEFPLYNRGFPRDGRLR